MSARSGTLLGTLRLALRSIQFLCSSIILALFSYFLATLSNHNLPTADWIRAVEGISGIAVLYTLLCILSICCFSATGVHPATSLLTMGLDIAFASAFIYIAAANKGGSGSCREDVDTPFGSGDADTGKVEGSGGWTALPSLKQACQMQTAVLAVAVVGLFMFIFSVVAEWLLIRHRRRENRYGPSPTTENAEGGEGPKKGGFWGMLFGRKKREEQTVDPANQLPEHTQPDELRSSYATDQTRVGTGYEGATKYESFRHEGMETGVVGTGQRRPSGWDDVPLAQYPPANYRYSDGVYERV